MSDFSTWLVRTLISGGGLLFLAWVALALTRHPARRQRLAAWTVRGAVLAAVLGLFPSWLLIPVPAEEPKPVTVAATVEEVPIEKTPLEWVLVDDVEPAPGVGDASSGVEPAAETTLAVTEPAPRADVPPTPWWFYAIASYAVLTTLALLQLVAAMIGLRRLKNASTPAPEFITDLAAELSAPLGVVAKVRLCSRLASPVCFGGRSKTILLPTKLAATASRDELRWVLAHELDHLRRGDPRTGVWVALARSLYFALPWFWAVRRELRLAQEFLADAAAAAGQPADYAEFLVSLSGLPTRPRTPLVAVAVRAGRTDLYRRVSMLTTTNVRDGVSRGWTLLTAGGTLAAAVGLSGLGLAEDKKTEERTIVIEARLDDGKPEKKPAKDGEKKETRTIEMKIAGPTEVQDLSKAVSAALEKGDVAAAKEAMAKLQKVLSAQPKIMTVHGNVLAPAFPAQPFVPATPAVPGVALWETRAKTDVKALEAKLEGMKKSLESVKDNPEAREALEKVMEGFKKQIEHAHKGAQDTIRRVEVWDAGKMKEMEADMAARRAKLEAELQALEAKMKSAEGDARVALERQRDALKDQAEAMKKRVMAFNPVQGEMRVETLPAFGQGGGVGGTAMYVRRGGDGRLGVTIDAIPDALVEHLGLEKGQGILVGGVREGSPAAKAGIKANDIVLSIGDTNVVSATELQKIVSKLDNDKPFTVLVLRKGKKEMIKDVVIPAPAERRRDESDSGRKAEGGSDWTKQIVTVNDGEFKIVAENKDATYTIVGSLEDGKPVVSSVKVGKESYKDLGQLSKSDRAAVESLLKNVSGGRRK